MKRQMKINRRSLELLKDFIKLYRDYNKGEKGNFYEKQLIEILEKYKHYTYLRKEWSKRND